jgi:predicted transposase/invertase (TIGR01784 family)
MKFVDPKTDIAFKKIFGDQAHKIILIEFLNELLELEYPITDVKISNSYQPPHLFGMKETTVDIKAKDSEGREFIVEMQVEKEKAFAKRAMYYSSKAYSQQLHKSEQYHLLKPVIFLGILDFSIFDHSNPCSRHLILNTENQQHDLKDLEFNFVELPKFTKSENQLETIADKWLYFLKHADDLQQIPANADTPALQQAYQIAAQHHWTEEELDIYEAQGLKLGKARNVIETAREDGVAEGLAKGELQGKLTVAKNLLAMLDDAAIAQVTGLDINTIANLRQS